MSLHRARYKPADQIDIPICCADTDKYMQENRVYESEIIVDPSQTVYAKRICSFCGKEEGPFLAVVIVKSSSNPQDVGFGVYVGAIDIDEAPLEEK